MKFVGACEYDGSSFSGFQSQKNAQSVQGTLEKAISSVGRLTNTINYSGRTDAGVHSSYFCAHFDYNQIINDKSNFIYKSNSFLPKDISISRIYKVKDDFHARFDALSRTYQYKINTFKNPFLIKSSYYLRKDINFHKMNLAALKLYNYKNFRLCNSCQFTSKYTDPSTRELRSQLATEGGLSVFEM